MDTFQIECLKDGTWSNKVPTCKSKKTKLVDYNDNEQAPSTGGIQAETTQGDSLAGVL